MLADQLPHRGRRAVAQQLLVTRQATSQVLCDVCSPVLHRWFDVLCSTWRVFVLKSSYLSNRNVTLYIERDGHYCVAVLCTAGGTGGAAGNQGSSLTPQQQQQMNRLQMLRKF